MNIDFKWIVLTLVVALAGIGTYVVYDPGFEPLEAEYLAVFDAVGCADPEETAAAMLRRYSCDLADGHVRVFVEGSDGTQSVEMVALLWGDIRGKTRHIGTAAHYAKKIARRYAPERAERMAKTFRAQGNRSATKNDFEISVSSGARGERDVVVLTVTER